MPYRIYLATLLLLLPVILTAQDTLPDFKVTTRDKKKILISWHNPYLDISQINIQRSSDSLGNFKTIVSIPDPDNLENGFVDSKAPNHRQYYRLFISLRGGNYQFSPIKKPVLEPEINSDKVSAAEAIAAIPVPPSTKENSPVELPGNIKIYHVIRKDSLIGHVNQALLNQIRDSIRSKTRDTLVFRKGDTVLIKPFQPKEVFRPSPYVYTNREGNVLINLPDADRKKYSIQFFDDQNEFLFRIGQVKDTPLIIDKANFLQSGWYRFELYEEGKLKEKNKFYIPRDF